MPSWSRKGKDRAVLRDGGAGGTEGDVLSLGVTTSGAFDMSVSIASPFFAESLTHLPLSAYTLDVYFGASQQKLSLQVDTGSSDLVRA